MHANSFSSTTKKIALVGSDLHPPFISMEAKLANILVQGCPNAEFVRVSICVGKQADSQPGFIFIDGIRKGPLFCRKVLYMLKLIKCIIHLRRLGYTHYHFIWTAPQLILYMLPYFIHTIRGYAFITVINRFLNPSIYNNFNVIVTHTNDTHQAISNIVDRHTRIETIPPPVPEYDGNLLDTTPTNPYHFIFLSAPKSKAQLHSRGISLLAQTFGILEEEGAPHELTIFNRWKEGERTIKREFAKYNISNVNIVTSIEIDPLREIISSCGVIVPYVGRCIGDVPLSALEAAASGRTVVATTGLGVAELLEDYPGYIAAVPNPRALAEALKRASEIIMNEHGYHWFGWRGITKETFCNRYSKLYGEVISA